MSIEDPLVLGGKSFNSRFILGSGKYSLDLVEAAVEHAGAQIITLALRRANSETDSILAHIPEGVTLLPNTSGARTAEEAVRIARLAREPKFDGFGKISFHNRVYIQLSFLRTVMKKSCLVPSLALTVAFVEPTFKPFKVKVMLFSVVRVAIELSSTVQVKVIFSPFLK